MKHRDLLIGLLCAVGLTLAPAAQEAIWPRPVVSTDWVKARCFEVDHKTGPGLSWQAVGDNRWYFSGVRFGIRRFDLGGGAWVFVFSPNGDGPRCYLYDSAGRLRESPDDAFSVNGDWAYVNHDDERSVLFYSDGFRDVP